MTEVQTVSESTRATGQACVFVVGMHRSGTSAIAGLLARLGLATPPVGDLIPATPSNPLGHFESRQLVAFNHRLLVRLGGSWTSPPDVGPGWESGLELEQLRDEGSRLLASTFPWRPAAWKDPRLCLLLPFWRAVVGPPLAAVFVWREPSEVAMSLQTRDGLGAVHAYALWERYVRRASSGLDGLPTLAADYNRVLDDPVGWCRQLTDFLGDIGVGTQSLTAEEARGALDAGMRRQRASGRPGVMARDDGELDSSSRDVFERLGAVHGPHASWRPPAFAEEPGWVSQVLAMRSELDSLQRSLRWVARSRAYRLAGLRRARRRSA